MKVKVISARDILKYLIKISLIFAILSIQINFFSKNKVENKYFKINASSFIKVINKEIALFRKNKENVEYLNYAKESFNNELNVLKLVAVNNLNNLNINSQTNNIENLNSISDTQNIENDTHIQNYNLENTTVLEEPQANVATEILPSNVIDKCTYEIFGVKLRNESDYNLLTEITDLNFNINKQDIIIFHTHTCESYTETEANQYEESGTFRTVDLNYTVSKVGDELEKYLKQYGYNVVHDKTYHDYPAYNGSYDRSIQTVKNLLGIYSNTDVVIDLHRDAIGDNTYAPTVKIGDEYCARIMFVIGTDGGGLAHQNWRENLKFAMKFQQKAEELYPRIV